MQSFKVISTGGTTKQWVTYTTRLLLLISLGSLDNAICKSYAEPAWTMNRTECHFIMYGAVWNNTYKKNCETLFFFSMRTYREHKQTLHHLYEFT